MKHLSNLCKFKIGLAAPRDNVSLRFFDSSHHQTSDFFEFGTFP